MSPLFETIYYASPGVGDGLSHVSGFPDIAFLNGTSGSWSTDVASVGVLFRGPHRNFRPSVKAFAGRGFRMGS